MNLDKMKEAMQQHVALSLDEEKLTNSANTFVNNYKDYTFRNWNEKLKEISIPFYEVKITTDEIYKLLKEQQSFNDNPSLYDSLDFFKNIKKVISQNIGFGNKYFAKFFTRSAKDIDEPIYSSPYYMMECFINSMRVFDDFCASRRATKNLDELVIYIRPFVEFDKKDEFRLFYVDGVVSVSSYHYQNDKTPITKNKVDSDILEWNEKYVKPYFEIENYCIDFIKKDGVFTLIEFNPWFLSDNILLDRDNIGKIETQITY